MGAPLELEAKFGEELNGGVDVFYHDADVVHTLDRHDVSLASRHYDCRGKRLTSASTRVSLREARAAECAQAFTTSTEVSHGQR
jgi:hypothetical protein